MRRFAAAAGAALVLAACGIGSERRARVADDKSVPFDLLAVDVEPVVPSTNAATAESVVLCFVDGDRLAVVTVQIDPPVRLADAVAALAEPPTSETQTLRTALPDASLVRQVRLSRGIAQVDLTQAISTLTGDEQLLVVAQIVCTLTARPGVGQVSFTLEGSPVDVPRDDGSLTAEPVSRDDYADLLD